MTSVIISFFPVVLLWAILTLCSQLARFGPLEMLLSLGSKRLWKGPSFFLSSVLSTACAVIIGSTVSATRVSSQIKIGQMEYRIAAAAVLGILALVVEYWFKRKLKIQKRKMP